MAVTQIADFGLANTLGNSQKFMSFVGTTPCVLCSLAFGVRM
jgi:hypothetical protein